MLEINNTSFEPRIYLDLLTRVVHSQQGSNGAAKLVGGSQLDLWQLIPIKLTDQGFAWTMLLGPQGRSLNAFTDCGILSKKHCSKLNLAKGFLLKPRGLSHLGPTQYNARCLTINTAPQRVWYSLFLHSVLALVITANLLL